ncbi:MAG TPA: PQQ-binding-like beta-propeller repeat protein [Patescibacteria group bacterium]|nr:PQQ-binding-like beta-propeller repeat protein [Patescibacteria group bacterium]
MTAASNPRVRPFGRTVIAALACMACIAPGLTRPEAVESRAAQSAAKTPADAWPSFRGNPQLSGASGADLPRDLVLVWSFEAGGGIESTAAIKDGAVYVGSLDGNLYCLSLDTGALKWKYAAGAGIKSSPSVFDGTVYFGDEAGSFHAVDASSGSKRWVFAAEAAIVSSASMVAGKVIFGSNDNHLYALSASDGTLAWKFATGSYVYATPALDEGASEPTVISAGCDGFMRRVRVRDGEVLVKIPLGGYVGASPAVRGGWAFVGTFENQVLGVDLRKGKIGWTYEHPEKKFPYYSSAALASDIVVVGGRDRMIHALKALDGSSIWAYTAGAKVDASPVIVGQRVLAATTGGDILALGLRQGDLLWRYETGSSIIASPSVASGRLVIGTAAGHLLAFGGK